MQSVSGLDNHHTIVVVIVVVFCFKTAPIQFPNDVGLF